MITAKSEVLNNDDKPIPGLYAAGNALGGIFYHDYIVGSQLTLPLFGEESQANKQRARAGAKQG